MIIDLYGPPPSTYHRSSYSTCVGPRHYSLSKEIDGVLFSSSPSMSIPITLIVSPFHVGAYNFRVGNGPPRILPGLLRALRAIDYDVQVIKIEKVDEFEGEIGKSFELLRRISQAVKQAVVERRFPIALAGNCHTSVAVAAGLNSAGVDTDNLHVYWTDAHVDAQTPDDNTSGYLDSMGISMLAGYTWKALTNTIPGHRVIPLDRVTFIGARDIESSEEQRIADAGSHIIRGVANANYASRLEDRLKDVAAETDSLVHVDLDALDPSVGIANEYPVPGGLLERDLIGVLRLLAKRNPVSLTVASFNPDCGNGEHIVNLAIDAVVEFLKVKDGRDQ